LAAQTLINKMGQVLTETSKMVYCPKCGTKNEDSATFCVKCGANLQTDTVTTRWTERRKAEQECFGLPHGGAIVGIVFGVIILIFGVFLVLQQAGVIVGADFPWFLLIIILGVLMIAGAVYTMSRSKNP
jgi:ribosomal protein L40E